MSRKRAVLAFLVILVSYAIFIGWSVYEHQLYVKAFEEEIEREYGPEEVRWSDHEPYIRRPYGCAAMVFGLVTVLAGLALACLTGSHKKIA